MIWRNTKKFLQKTEWGYRAGQSLCGITIETWATDSDLEQETTCPECLIILANQQIRRIAEIGFRDRMKKCLNATAKEKR